MNLLAPAKRLRLIEALVMGLSIREAMAHANVAINTARRYARLNGPFKCACGRPRKQHRGWCSERLKRSPARRAFLAQWRRTSPPPKIIVERDIARDNNLGRQSGAALFRAVNAAVSRSLPPDIRADICQDVLIAILEGRATINAIGEAVRLALKMHRKSLQDGWNPVSLDATIPGTDGLKVGDLIESDRPHV